MKKGELTVWTEAVQVKIKQLIVDGVLSGEPRQATWKRIKATINKYAERVPQLLRVDFVRTLTNGALRLYGEFRAEVENTAQDFGLSLLFLGALFRGENKAIETAQRSGKPVAEQVIETQANYERRLTEGGKEDYTEYIYPDRIDVADVRKKVKTKIRDLSATETEKGDGHNLRNRAEMYVRHEAQQQSIDEMRRQGVKLVWASTHADCSTRCAPWQGRLYSLDGTYGEVNGYKYQPLENAVNVYVTTRTGRVWKNGLLGFNCRHRLIPYNEHQMPPKSFSEKEMERRRVLNERQRAAERNIRRQKSLAWELIHQDKNAAQKLFDAAKRDEQRYREFCRKNNLVALPYRTQVMIEEMPNVGRK